MYKVGTVTKLDHDKALATVAFREEQGRDGGDKFEVELAVLQPHVLEDKYYSMPGKGEQVVCLLDENWETGFIIGSAYTKKTKTTGEMKKDRTVFKSKDGTLFQYDCAAKTLLIDAVGDITIKATSGTVKIEALTVEVKATTAKIEATTATIKASAGTASLLDTFTGLTTHLFVPNA
jgi:phage baseplate assembly protein V